MEQNSNESPLRRPRRRRGPPRRRPRHRHVRSPRHDGFTPERRRQFLETLRETGCVQDACRVVGISDSGAYKTRKRDPEFRELWDAALSKAAADTETLAWHRAVVGVKEEIWAYGKLVGTRRKRDDKLFRMLVQASDPNRYGGPARFTPRAIEQRIRARIEEEQRLQDISEAEVEEVRARVARRIARLRKRELEKGNFYENEDGLLVPVGYVRADQAGAAPAGFGPGVAGSGPDRTDSEPDESLDMEDEESRFSAGFRPPGPRITQL